MFFDGTSDSIVGIRVRVRLDDGGTRRPTWFMDSRQDSAKAVYPRSVGRIPILKAKNLPLCSLLLHCPLGIVSLILGSTWISLRLRGMPIHSVKNGWPLRYRVAIDTLPWPPSVLFVLFVIFSQEFLLQTPLLCAPYLVSTRNVTHHALAARTNILRPNGADQGFVRCPVPPTSVWDLQCRTGLQQGHSPTGPTPAAILGIASSLNTIFPTITDMCHTQNRMNGFR
ncbi:hypothetical protein BS50DRAFT_249992 [Corynespora cassiicola Philippines]|uniref:Uncharacterized protein n=1 Tax=Corynespora cassiicola Philippines TaxID=1448308 RepID=A0A2T2P416_CORCC|nr:hypothetical protein BS50DRAFT_249992 [Corynespora cassiicola Philippines]